MVADLSPEYIATLRRMTGAEKLRAAFGLYWTARRVKAVGRGIYGTGARTTRKP